MDGIGANHMQTRRRWILWALGWLAIPLAASGDVVRSAGWHPSYGSPQSARCATETDERGICAAGSASGNSNAAIKASVIQPGDPLNISGIWFDPNAPGDGFTVTQGNAGIVIYFFGYDARGERLWLVSDVIQSGVYAAEPVVVEVVEGDSGTFAVPDSPVNSWGMLTVTAEDCERAEFELDGVDGRKVLSAVRLADGGSPCEQVPPTTSALPFQELYDQGVDRYLGVFTPNTVQRLDTGVTVHEFDQESGPLCFTGNPYSVSTRPGAGGALMIFLQGGGACGPGSCGATESTGPALPAIGILDSADGVNPTAAYDVGYVPYCDGTLFSGDNDVDSDGDGEADRFFRGVQNLSAALDVIARTFPSPGKILLAGNSAGGSGVHNALPLVRKLYPGVAIEVLNDSGVGVLAPGVIEELLDYWNAFSSIPSSCSGCIGEDGHLTGYHRYQLAEDRNVRMGFISSKQDEVVAVDSLMISGAAFEAELLEAMAELRAAFPDRFRSLIADGNEHTFILRQFDYAIGGTTVRQWVTDMLDGNAAWVSISD
ncbi:MAG: pectin acetylesterase-family hydrolase [Pseudomonadota bacterium]